MLRASQCGLLRGERPARKALSVFQQSYDYNKISIIIISAALYFCTYEHICLKNTRKIEKKKEVIFFKFEFF